MINPLQYKEVSNSSSSAFFSKIFSSKRLELKGLSNTQTIAFDKYVKPADFEASQKKMFQRGIKAVQRSLNLKTGSIWIKVVELKEAGSPGPVQYARINKNSLCRRLNISKEELNGWLKTHPNGDVTQLVSKKVNEAILNSDASSPKDKAAAHAELAVIYADDSNFSTSLRHCKEALIAVNNLSDTQRKSVESVFTNIVASDRFNDDSLKFECMSAVMKDGSLPAELKSPSTKAQEKIMEKAFEFYAVPGEKGGENPTELLANVTAKKLAAYLVLHFSEKDPNKAENYRQKFNQLLSPNELAELTFKGVEENFRTRIAMDELIVKEEGFSDEARFSAYKEMGDYYYSIKNYDQLIENYQKIEYTHSFTAEDRRRYIDYRFEKVFLSNDVEAQKKELNQMTEDGIEEANDILGYAAFYSSYPYEKTYGQNPIVVPKIEDSNFFQASDAYTFYKCSHTAVGKESASRPAWGLYEHFKDKNRPKVYEQYLKEAAELGNEKAIAKLRDDYVRGP